MITVEEAAAVIDDSKYYPASDTARGSCPLCGGNPTALSIRQGEKKILFTCHKGCSSVEVSREINRRIDNGETSTTTTIKKSNNRLSLEAASASLANASSILCDVQQSPYADKKLNPFLDTGRLELHAHEARAGNLAGQEVTLIPNRDETGACLTPIGYEVHFRNSRTKYFVGKKTGGFLTLGNSDLTAPTCIVEGWGTGLGCLALWGYDIRVLVAFGKARLEPIYDLIAPTVERCCIIDDEPVNDSMRKRFCFGGGLDAWDFAYQRFCRG